MRNPVFRFKQFELRHDQCAMKVGTDGVLLGAWANIDNDNSSVKRILDIGTGTGLIACMLAQRTKQHIHIDAVEIDPAAAAQAAENAQNTPWANRLTIIPADIRQFAFQTEHRYDLIVSNPPYFEHSLTNQKHTKTIARHTKTLPIGDFWQICAHILTPQGKICVILPPENEEKWQQHAHTHQFHLEQKTVVLALPNTPPKRLLLSWTKTPPTSPQHNALCIAQSTQRHDYTDEYVQLTKDFYLFVK